MEDLISTLRSRRLGILFVLKLIPLDLWDWKPDPSMKSTAQLANHLACSPLSILNMLRGDIPDEETYNNIETTNMPLNAQGLTKLYEEGLNKLLAYLEDHLEDARVENIKLFYREGNSSIYKEIFEEIGHEWFHLGQLFTYLKQKGVKVDMFAYYGLRDPDPEIPPNK
ncbi:MAG: DinB family protein [Candidatus Hodarchaeales archaeon]